MATPTEVEAALNVDYTVDAGSAAIIRIGQTRVLDATYSQYWVTSRANDLVNKGSWVRVFTANSAGGQADEIRVALAQHAPVVNIGP